MCLLFLREAIDDKPYPPQQEQAEGEHEADHSPDQVVSPGLAPPKQYPPPRQVV